MPFPRVVGHQRVFAPDISACPVDRFQRFHDILEHDRREAWTGERNRQRIDIVSIGATSHERDLRGCRSAPHEWIMDNIACLRQSFDEEPGQLRLEAGSIRNLVSRTRLTLAGGPEFVDEAVYAVDHPDSCRSSEATEAADPLDEVIRGRRVFRKRETAGSLHGHSGILSARSPVCLAVPRGRPLADGRSRSPVADSLPGQPAGSGSGSAAGSKVVKRHAQAEIFGIQLPFPTPVR